MAGGSAPRTPISNRPPASYISAFGLWGQYISSDIPYVYPMDTLGELFGLSEEVYGPDSAKIH